MSRSSISECVRSWRNNNIEHIWLQIGKWSLLYGLSTHRCLGFWCLSRCFLNISITPFNTKLSWPLHCLYLNHFIRERGILLTFDPDSSDGVQMNIKTRLFSTWNDLLYIEAQRNTSSKASCISIFAPTSSSTCFSSGLNWTKGQWTR